MMQWSDNDISCFSDIQQWGRHRIDSTRHSKRHLTGEWSVFCWFWS
jgi:hypothetical protein